MIVDPGLLTWCYIYYISDYTADTFIDKYIMCVLEMLFTA